MELVARIHLFIILLSLLFTSLCVLFDGFGTCLGNGNISGPTELRVTPQHQECPQQCCSRPGCCPLSESQPRLIWCHFKQVLLNPLSADSCWSWAWNKARLWPLLNLEMWVWGLCFGAHVGMTVQCELWLLLVQFQQRNIAVLESCLKPAQISSRSELSPLKQGSSRKLLVIYSNMCWVLSQVVVLAPSTQKKMFPFLLKEQPFSSLVLPQKSPHLYLGWMVWSVEDLVEI